MIPTAVKIKTKKAIIPPIMAPCITRISVIHVESNLLTKRKKKRNLESFKNHKLCSEQTLNYLPNAFMT